MRLLKRSNFSQVSTLGRRFYSKLFIILALEQQPPTGNFRLGLIVSKKHGCAVWRNRVKRLLREFFRLNQAAVPAKLDLVVIPKAGLDPRTLAYALVSRDLQPVLYKLTNYES